MRLLPCVAVLALSEWAQRVGGIFVRSTPNATEVSVQGGADTRQSVAPEPAQDYFVPQFFAPQLTPTQFLFVSSPSAGKVVYSELKNFKSLTGRTFALVDSGLAEPAGLAFDNDRGLLYVADRGMSKIFRYRVLLQESSSGGLALATDGVRLCVMQGHPVEWVTVDPSGSIYYTDTGANTINRISFDVLEKIGEGSYQCGDLKVVTQKEQMAKAETTAASALTLNAADRVSEGPTDAPDTLPEIFTVYEGSVNPHVAVPSGISSDGNRLWWGNKVEGNRAGSVVQGEASPQPSLLAPDNVTGEQTFPATALTSLVDTTYGVAHSNTMVFFTANKTGSGSVYGVMGDGTTMQFVSSLVMPRGLVWDGDNTVYVADQAVSKVYSFPVGRLMDDAPLTQSVAYSGAFGVALFTKSRANSEAVKAGAMNRGGGMRILWLLLPLVASMCPWDLACDEC